jgi:hypothetical protein
LLNQRQTIKLSEMFEESVELDGVSKPRERALRVIEGPGRDAWTMLDTCVVEMSPANKGKKGERASWSAECEETRHASGTLSSGSRRYVFSGAGTLLAIDNP